jgi:hypothetical protein
MKSTQGWTRIVTLGLVLVAVLTMHGVAGATPFTQGDIFASVGNGLVKEFTPTGTLVQTLNSVVSR